MKKYSRFQMAFNSEGFHWSCMPSKQVTQSNAESFINALDRTEVSRVVAIQKPEWSQEYTTTNWGTSLRGFELLYTVGSWRIRVRVEFEKLSDPILDERPIRADLELEKNGIRRNYSSIDTEVILRVMRHVRNIAQQHAMEERLRKEVLKGKETIRDLEQKNRELRKKFNTGNRIVS